MSQADVKEDGAVNSLVKPLRLARGTSVTTDMAKTRRFHEEFLGLECVEYAPGAMLTRDFGEKPGGRLDGGDYWVLDTRLVDRIEQPQCAWNHWGIDVGTPAEVDEAHRVANEQKDYYGLDVIEEVRNQHGSYSFYFSDVMGNWWEVQCPMRSAEQLAEARQAFL
ncbi:VOC family protein [Sphingobium chungangianum]